MAKVVTMKRPKYGRWFWAKHRNGRMAVRQVVNGRKVSYKAVAMGGGWMIQLSEGEAILQLRSSRMRDGRLIWLSEEEIGWVEGWQTTAIGG